MAFLPSQDTIWIDPSNRTGAATDANSGSVKEVPVRTFNRGVLARFGGESVPEVTEGLTLNFLSGSPTDNSDPIIFSPALLKQSTVRINAFLDVHNQVAAGTLASLVAKDRAAGVLLQADLGALAAPGQVVVNTTAGKASRAMVLNVVAGTVFALSQPLSISDTWPLTGDPSSVDTWANGDTFALYTQDMLDIVRLEPVVGEFDPTQANEFLVVTNAGVLNATSQLSGLYVGDAVAFSCSQVQKKVVMRQSALERNTYFFGCAGAQLAGGSHDIRGIGNKIGLWAGSWGKIVGSGVYLDNDIVLRSSLTRLLGGMIGTACIDQGFALELAEQVVLEDDGAIWGKGSLDVSGRLTLGATAAATLLQSGGFTINGKTSVFSATSTTPSIVDGATALTPANIDLLGNLYWPGGGAIATS